MAFESHAEEYLEILQSTREQLAYLHELGVENLETGNLPSLSRTKPAREQLRSESRTSVAKPIDESPPSRPSVPAYNPAPAQVAEPTISLFADISAPPVRLEKSSETFEEIWADIGNCTRCPLYERRTNIVHTEGNPIARLMFVGEAPGADEDAQARPFVGRAGQLLTKIIEAIGFKREEVLIGNVNRCRPPGNRPPTEEEASICKPFLLREIAAVQPEVIVVLGNTATRNLLNTKVGITRLRGEFQEYHGVKVMPTFHPAYLLRDPSKKQETWQDLKKVRDYLESTRKTK
ncbi:MAG TPA: uracil-DNA glycosylase [Pyrinomonadaceae bacterium]|nr:uracil-DNA glycosylase [Pyrinomonadaceae bacterium]